MFSLDVAQLSATVRNCPQPFATVRNRPREVAMAVPMASSAKGVTSEDEFQFLWQARHFRRVVFLRIALSGLCQVVTSAISVAGVTFCPM